MPNFTEAQWIRWQELLRTSDSVQARENFIHFILSLPMEERKYYIQPLKDGMVHLPSNDVSLMFTPAELGLIIEED